MDTILLRSFLTVAELGSFTAAAERLNSSQSTVSGHIARLEDLLSSKLFVRTTRKCSLSAAGEALLPMAEDAVRAFERIEDVFRPSTMRGMIRLGVPDDYHLFGRINQAVHAFNVLRPAVLVQIDAGLSGTHAKWLNEGLLDLAILRVPSKTDDPAEETSKLIWIGAQTLDLNPNDPLPLAHMNGPCQYFRAAVNALSESGLKWRSTYSCSALEGVRGAVRSGMAVSAILAEDCPEPDLRLVRPWLPKLPHFSLAFRFAKPDPPVLVRALEKRLRDSVFR